MFKRIVIELTGPICNCEFQHLAWWPTSIEGKWGLVLECSMCGTKLTVSNAKFVAGWALDTPYPAGVKPRSDDESKKGLLSLILGGKEGEKK